MIKKPLITVGIPTFNRCNELDNSLKAIYNEIVSLDQHIELLISDNNSNDNTKGIIDKWSKKLKITYIKNLKNIGFDRNVDNVMKHASGDYVLIMSDDDILIKGSLKLYLDALNEVKEAIVFIGKARFMNYDLTQESYDFRDKAFDNFKDTKMYFFKNGEQLFSFSKKFFCGISGLMFKKDNYLNEDLDDFKDSQFIHSAAIFKILSKKESKVCVINKPCFLYRMGKTNNSKIKTGSEIFTVGFGLLNLLNDVKKFYDTKVWVTLYQKELNWVRSLVLGVKAREGLSKKARLSYKNCLNKDRKWKIIDHILINSPDSIYRFPYKIYRLIRYKKISL